MLASNCPRRLIFTTWQNSDSHGCKTGHIPRYQVGGFRGHVTRFIFFLLGSLEPTAASRAVGLSVPVGGSSHRTRGGAPRPQPFLDSQEIWVLSGPPGVEWVDLVAMFYMYGISFIPIFWFVFIPLSGLWENTVAAKIS